MQSTRVLGTENEWTIRQKTREESVECLHKE